MVLIVTIAVILSAASAFVSTGIIKDLISRQFQSKANDLAATVAVTVDSGYADSLQRAVAEIYESTEDKVGSEYWGTPEFDAYVSRYDELTESMGYKTLLDTLRKIQENNSVNCIYLEYVDPDTKKVIYMVDAALEDPCPTGCFDPLYEINYRVLDDPTIGFPAYITDTPEYGWLVSAASPVYDITGKVVCYAAVDISMEEVRNRQISFIVFAILIETVLTVIICIFGILCVNNFIVKPINLLADAASKHCSGDGEHTGHHFEELNIHTGDELESLADSMQQMEREIRDHIETLTATMEELRETREEADRMDMMANMDALTGVRNRRAYDEEAKSIDESIPFDMDEFGIAMIDLNYLKKINDTYGHDAGNIALKKLCHLICAVFVHSPVFRIGGDEFTVILRGRDYNNIENLVASFNKKIDGLSSDEKADPAERISAAIGYATFEKAKDRCVDDVFKRADEAMYERKKIMKEGKKDR